MSTRKSRQSCARDVALFRYSLIRPLADPALTAAERGVLVRELAAGVHVGPCGEAVRVSRSTLDRWIRTWRSGGFDALIPPVRHVHPRTAADALELAVRLKRERPTRTAAHIVRIIETSQGWAPSARTLQRHFVRLELNRRPDGTMPEVFGRFEADAPNVLWVTDGLHGPLIDGKRAVLFALLDDHSRFVVGHRWGFGEDTLGMQAALHDAVKTNGCPSWLYADNGSAYSSGQLAWSAAVLDIKITHSRPGRPQGRGKIERWNRTGPDQLRRAFLWRERRTVSTVATVALHGNRYEVDASLTGRKVDLLLPGRTAAFLRRSPLRTVHAPHQCTRLKQAARALRVDVLASRVGGLVARCGRRRVSSGFVYRPACRARPGGRGTRRRSPCGRCSTTSVPTRVGIVVAGLR